MTNDALREKIARTIAEVHGAADTTREPLYTDDADAVLAALGLGPDVLAMVADTRFSNEYVGMLLRSRLLATGGPQDG